MSHRVQRPRLHTTAGAAAVLLLLLAACGPAEQRGAPGTVGREVAIQELSRANAHLAPGNQPAGGKMGVSGIVPLSPRPPGDHADSIAFRHFVQRCNACHAAPDPSMHTAGEWALVISRMKNNTRLAGLLPLRPQEERAILDFLAHRDPVIH